MLEHKKTNLAKEKVHEPAQDSESMYGNQETMSTGTQEAAG